MHSEFTMPLYVPSTELPTPKSGNGVVFLMILLTNTWFVPTIYPIQNLIRSDMLLDPSLDLIWQFSQFNSQFALAVFSTLSRRVLTIFSTPLDLIWWFSQFSSQFALSVFSNQFSIRSECFLNSVLNSLWVFSQISSQFALSVFSNQFSIFSEDLPESLLRFIPVSAYSSSLLLLKRFTFTTFRAFIDSWFHSWFIIYGDFLIVIVWLLW